MLEQEVVAVTFLLVLEVVVEPSMEEVTFVLASFVAQEHQQTVDEVCRHETMGFEQLKDVLPLIRDVLL